MAKIDQEALKKHQFWIGLGVFVLVWLIGIIIVLVTANDKAKKDWESVLTGIKTAQNQGPKTPAYNKPWEVHKNKFMAQKDKVWKKAWSEQEPMYTWPQGMPTAVQVKGQAPSPPLYLTDIFGDGPTEDENGRDKYRRDLYETQFAEVEKDYVAPAIYRGTFKDVFPRQRWQGDRAPTREEIWLAQEDFWVRRELLAIVRATIDSVAWFQETTTFWESLDRPKGTTGRRIFRNANWELDLLFEPTTNTRRTGWVISDQSTIKNINASMRTLNLANPRTKLGLPFRLIQADGAAIYELRIAGEPLAHGASMKLPRRFDAKTKEPREYDVNPVDLRRPIFVEQLLEWEISPVRRIDVLALGYHSHRTVTHGLKAHEELKKQDEEDAKKAGEEPPPEAGADASGGAGGAPAAAGGGKLGGRGEGAGTPDGGTAGPGGGGPLKGGTRVNNIVRERYVQVTPQCKHLPVAMRLIVDQSHIQDVLAAVANSRLRLQVTQVTATVAHDVRPNQPEAGSGEGAGGTPGGPGRGLYLAGTRPPSMPPPNSGTPDGGPGDMAGGGTGRPGRLAGFSGAGLRLGMTGPTPGAGGPGPGYGYGRDDDPGMVGPGTAGAAQFQDRSGLVELCIYGIAALYDRYPPRPPKTETPEGESGGTPATTNPAAGKQP